MGYHYSFVDIANKLASEDWGNSFGTREEAEKFLTERPDKLAAYASLALLQRLNRLAYKPTTPRPDPPQDAEKPDNAKAFPNKQVGDVLYFGDIEDGVRKVIIVARDSEGFCRTVLSIRSKTLTYTAWTSEIEWGTTNCYETIEGWLRSEIEYEHKHLVPRVEFANRALEALDSGADITEFVHGHSDEEE